jgi:coenzyme F420 hydrogenase subunit beta
MMYFEAVRSYLRSNGERDLNQVTELRYREGEWPGYLEVKLRSGRVLRAPKFYYNYLIPFYITQSSLLSVDFTNELTDISVGDAWHPRYETQGGGFSVVVARSREGEAVLQSMLAQGQVALEQIALDEALAMHGHMLDMKKRGAFIRMGWRAALGRAVPDYGYYPASIPLSRKAAEAIIDAVFGLGRTRLARWMIEQLPISLVGPLFDALRKTWKRASKPTKRKGLGKTTYVVKTRPPGPSPAHAEEETSHVR